MSDFFRKLFIFEMANNHQGDLQHGLNIIAEMGKIRAKHGINAAVKFQYRQLESFIHPDFRERKDVKHIPRFMETELDEDSYIHMLDATERAGMLRIVTPFDEPSVDLCVKHDVDVIKIASCSIIDWPLLEKIALAKKPVIASTGGATLAEIDNVVSFLRHRHIDFALLHCVSVYPTPNADLQLFMIKRLAQRFPDLIVGYSGHEAPDNHDVGKVAAALGAEILERHVGLPTENIVLNKYSMNPQQAEAWVAGVQASREMLGEVGEKRIPEEERLSLLSLQRGVYAKKAIRKGTEISAGDVFFAMPCADGQLTSGEFGRYRTRWFASQDYAANEAICEQQTSKDPISVLRSTMHEAKGLLNEAGIFIGDEVSVELSHHYGMERFRDVGALLITVINREYCKKLIVVLPKQYHPPHRHHKKEETFQLLWGDLSIKLDDETRNLKPGDVQTVMRGVWHSFSSKGGAIFEEISTTHVKGDSEYQDAQINRMDLISRKTSLNEW